MICDRGACRAQRFWCPDAAADTPGSERRTEGVRCHKPGPALSPRYPGYAPGLPGAAGCWRQALQHLSFEHLDHDQNFFRR